MKEGITKFLVKAKDQIKFASKLIIQVLSSYHLNNGKNAEKIVSFSITF